MNPLISDINIDSDGTNVKIRANTNAGYHQRMTVTFSPPQGQGWDGHSGFKQLVFEGNGESNSDMNLTIDGRQWSSGTFQGVHNKGKEEWTILSEFSKDGGNTWEKTKPQNITERTNNKHLRMRKTVTTEDGADDDWNDTILSVDIVKRS